MNDLLFGWITAWHNDTHSTGVKVIHSEKTSMITIITLRIITLRITIVVPHEGDCRINNNADKECVESTVCTGDEAARTCQCEQDESWHPNLNMCVHNEGTIIGLPHLYYDRRGFS